MDTAYCAMMFKRSALHMGAILWMNDYGNCENNILTFFTCLQQLFSQWSIWKP